MDNEKRDKHYTIGELTELTGISRRSVHYYVQRGLTPPPLGAGRGHYYTAIHLTRIRAIKEFQGQGLTLEEIEERFKTPQPDILKNVLSRVSSDIPHSLKESALSYEEASEPTLLTRIKVAEGVEMTIESGTYRLSPARLRKIQRAVRDILGPGFSPSDQGAVTEKEEEEEG